MTETPPQLQAPRVRAQKKTASSSKKTTKKVSPSPEDQAVFVPPKNYATGQKRIADLVPRRLFSKDTDLVAGYCNRTLQDAALARHQEDQEEHQSCRTCRSPGYEQHPIDYPITFAYNKSWAHTKTKRQTARDHGRSTVPSKRKKSISKRSAKSSTKQGHCP